MVEVDQIRQVDQILKIGFLEEIFDKINTINLVKLTLIKSISLFD